MMKAVVLRSIIRGPLSKEILQNYAHASLDFNPIHLDDSFAQKAGFPSVIAHGMLSMAFMGDFILLNFPRDAYRVKTFSCRFKKVVFPGDTLTVNGQVKQESSDSITLQISVSNQKNEVTSQGEAIIEILSGHLQK